MLNKAHKSTKAADIRHVWTPQLVGAFVENGTHGSVHSADDLYAG